KHKSHQELRRMRLVKCECDRDNLRDLRPWQASTSAAPLDLLLRLLLLLQCSTHSRARGPLVALLTVALRATVPLLWATTLCVSVLLITICAMPFRFKAYSPNLGLEREKNALRKAWKSRTKLHSSGAPKKESTIDASACSESD